MKRINNLFDVIISDENLRLAINEVSKTHRWKHYPTAVNRKVMWVMCTENERIEELRQIIVDGFVSSEYVEKSRYDGNARKWRKVCEPKIWPDQYIHHALIQALQPIMMRGMDYWCCGSIKGRGAHYGIKGIKKWMRTDIKNTHYCIEADIHHFYDSIESIQIMNRFKQIIKDHRALDLIWRIIKDGVRIGFYTSQWFANVMLQPLDHYIRENFKVGHYIRYMDNFTIFTNRERDAKKILKGISKWLEQHGLKLKKNHQIFKIANYMDKENRIQYRLPNALGYRFGRGFTLLRKHTLLKLKRTLKRYYFMCESGIKISLHFAQGLISRLGMLRHCNDYMFRQLYIKKGTLKKLKKIVKKYMTEAKVKAKEAFNNEQQRCTNNLITAGTY